MGSERTGNAARRQWFGTDGVRGRFGEPPLDRATVRALALALGERLATGGDGEPPVAVIGGDTRASTPVLCRWLADALGQHGVVVRFVGVLPTPGIAWLARHLGAVGIAVSASHNPAGDNGIKLIDQRGFKWPVEDEADLEQTMVRWLDDADAEGRSTLRPATDGSEDSDVSRRGVACHALAVPSETDTEAGAQGRSALRPDNDNDVDDASVAAYLDALAASVPGERPLAGLHLAVDTANGAASAFARPLLERLGARVSTIGDAPDGDNINLGCGSTHPDAVAALTREVGADLGIALDGDADRAILVDGDGTVRDGDAILYLWARDLDARGALGGRAVVATTMSNLGLEHALGRHGVDLLRTDVGDRAVVERLRADGLVLGGEQSGHIVNLDLATTGDGLLTAVHLATLCARAGRPLADLLEGFERFPQLIENVHVRAKPALDSLPAVVAARREVERALGVEGRLVLRYSGTEPLARIMIEGRDEPTILAHAARLAEAIRAQIGA